MIPPHIKFSLKIEGNGIWVINLVRDITAFGDLNWFNGIRQKFPAGLEAAIRYFRDESPEEWKKFLGETK